MRQYRFLIALTILLLAAAFGWFQIVEGQGPVTSDGRRLVKRETQDLNAREITAPQINAPQQPNISFIDSPTISCYQPDPTQDACYLNWYYASVNASPNYMVAMTITVNAIGVVNRMQGFFQTSMYMPYSMQGQGIKVSCGALGAGGQPGLGNAYAWTINAQDSANLKSANYGTAYCPARKP